MSTTTAHLGLVKPESTDNISPYPYNDNFDKIDDEIFSLQTDYIVAQGEQGMWTYRRWFSGMAECWIEAYKLSSIDIVYGWNSSNLYTGYIPSPGEYPFTFKTNPIVIPTWASSSNYSCPIWAAPNGTTTTCPRFQLIDPTNGTQTNAVIGVYVKGTWK